MSEAKIYIGTPCYGGQCFNGYVSSLLQTVQYFKDQNIPINLEIRFLTNESLITRGRNLIVAQFLGDSTATHLLFIDADISWHPSTIQKLIKADKDIVGAVYPKKFYHWDKLNKLLPEVSSNITLDQPLDKKVESFIKANLLNYTINYSDNSSIIDSLLEVKHIGTGFMLIKRQVLEKMCERFPQYKFEDDTGLLTPNENIHLYSLFDCEVSLESDGKNHYLSEDYLFCKRWRAMGGKVYAEVTSILTHTGTHAFQGNYLASLRFGPESQNLLNSPLTTQDMPTELKISENFSPTFSDKESLKDKIDEAPFKEVMVKFAYFGVSILICNLAIYFYNV
jgi:hypothetical protein